MSTLRSKQLAIVAMLSAACIFATNRFVHPRNIEKTAMKGTITPKALEDAKKGRKHSAFIELWDEYLSQHSEEALRNEFAESGTFHNNPRRKFAIGYYSCPNQAGNRIHHFLNNFIWAIVTNRTLLWKYYDEETCEVAGRGFARRICQSANTEPDCAKILKRAEFLPSYDYWSSKLELPPPYFLPYWSTGIRLESPRYWYEGVENDVVPGLVDTTNQTLVVYAQMFEQDFRRLSPNETRDRLLNTTSAKDRVSRLLSEGVEFLYGFLFFNTFTFQPSISIPPKFPNKSIFNESIGIVLHSRHQRVEDDGSDIEQEMYCLHEILNGTQVGCLVSLLSDRDKTLESVGAFLASAYPDCTVLVAPHETGESFNLEHGPFAGVGFYQDLALVSNQTLHVSTTKSAFIGSARSSSKIVKEVMSYQLHQRMHSEDSSGELLSCRI